MGDLTDMSPNLTWNKAPDWAICLVKNHDGRLWWHEQRPVPAINKTWESSTGRTEFAEHGIPPADFTKEIEYRPDSLLVPSATAVRSAPDYLESARAEMEDRAASRDQPGGERSMRRAVEAFNALYGKDLSEEQGWQFMSLLKKARGAQGEYRESDYTDDVAYCALAAESATKQNGSD